MANAVKFRAQVLGQKATHLVRPYRAYHCFTTQTQGDALGFHRTPRWGWEGVVRLTASHRRCEGNGCGGLFFGRGFFLQIFECSGEFFEAFLLFLKPLHEVLQFRGAGLERSQTG